MRQLPSTAVTVLAKTMLQTANEDPAECLAFDYSWGGGPRWVAEPLPVPGADGPACIPLRRQDGDRVGLGAVGTATVAAHLYLPWPRLGRHE